MENYKLLYRQLAVYVLLAVGFVFAITAVFCLRYVRLSSMEQAEKYAKKESALLAYQLNSFIDAAKSITATYNTRVMETIRNDSTTAYAMLINTVFENPMVSSGSFIFPNKDELDETGYVVYRNGDTIQRSKTQLVEMDVLRREWFTSAIESGKPYWSKSYVDFFSNRPVITYCHPLFNDKGEVSVVASLDIDLDQLYSLTDSALVYPNSMCALTDFDNRVLFIDADSHLAHGDIFQGICSSDTLVYKAKVPNYGWNIYTCIPHTDIYGDIPAMRHKMLLIFAISLSVIGLLSLIVIKRGCQPFIEHHTMLKMKQARTDKEMSMAQSIQKSMLPATLPQLEAAKVWATQVSARDVGGDLYDCFVSDGIMYLAIGDVSGKGMPAALIMSVVSKLLRIEASRIAKPEFVANAINRSLCDNNEQRLFCTAFLAMLNLATGELTYCSAGHDPVVLLRNGGKPEFLPTPPKLPLGVRVTTSYKSTTVQLSPGDRLLLYTDGVTEAENDKAELFGDDRMIASLKATAHQSTVEMGEHLLAAIKAHAEGHEQSDDITMLAVTFHGWTNELKLAPVLKSIGLVKTFVEAIKAPAEQTDQMSLALEEWVANVINYSQATEHIHIAASHNLQGYHLVITDNGIPFDPTSRPEQRPKPDPKNPGGFGIYLIRQLAKEITYSRTDNHNVLAMTF